MSSLTNKQVEKTLQIYKHLRISKDQVLKGKEVLDIFRVLKIKPEIDKSGKRKITPYELLGVPPQIVNGKEKPIVFAIKNRTDKIGHYTGEVTDFVFKPKRVMEEDSLLETLKINYKHALMFGTDEEAEKYLQLIDEYTGGGAKEFLRSFYDYTKFYRRMKKQLLIDIFAHFFLMYMSVASITIKDGIIKIGEFRPFREKKSNSEFESREFQNFEDKNAPIIANISIDKTYEDEVYSYNEPAETNNFVKPKENINEDRVNIFEEEHGIEHDEHKDFMQHTLFKMNKKRRLNKKGFKKYNIFHDFAGDEKHAPEESDKFLQQQENQGEFDFQS